MADRSLRELRDLDDPRAVAQVFRQAVRCADASCARIEFLAELGDPLAREALGVRVSVLPDYDAVTDRVAERPGALIYLALELTRRCRWAFAEGGQELPPVVERVLAAVDGLQLTAANVVALRFELDDQWPQPSIYGRSLGFVETLLRAALYHLLDAVAGRQQGPGVNLVSRIARAASCLVADERNVRGGGHWSVAHDLMLSLLRGWAIHGPPPLPQLDPSLAGQLARQQAVEVRSPWEPVAGAANLPWGAVLRVARNDLPLAAALGLHEARQLLGSEAPGPHPSSLEDDVADYRFVAASLVRHRETFAARVLRDALAPCVNHWDQTFPGNPALRRAYDAESPLHFEIEPHLEACAAARAIAVGAQQHALAQLCDVMGTMLRARNGHPGAYPLYRAFLAVPSLYVASGAPLEEAYVHAFHALRRSALPLLVPSG